MGLSTSIGQGMWFGDNFRPCFSFCPQCATQYDILIEWDTTQPLYRLSGLYTMSPPNATQHNTAKYDTTIHNRTQHNNTRSEDCTNTTHTAPHNNTHTFLWSTSALNIDPTHYECFYLFIYFFNIMEKEIFILFKDSPLTDGSQLLSSLQDPIFCYYLSLFYV